MLKYIKFHTQSFKEFELNHLGSTLRLELIIKLCFISVGTGWACIVIIDDDILLTLHSF